VFKKHEQGENMETQGPTEVPQTEFLPGSFVIYAMHGKCHIVGTETRTLSGMPILFYKLEIKKSTLSRSTKLEPAIWVPVENAKDRGLRAPMSKAEAEAAMKILFTREYYFKLNESWSSIQHKLENMIRLEAGVGLSKVASYLYVLSKKQIVPTTEVTKLKDTVFKLLFRELGEALEELPKVLEEKANKGLRTKLLPDS
jgi:RNA polymerase-interacting CarD/CdnL/TRCF family regulator